MKSTSSNQYPATIPFTWILTDDKPGNRTQALGVAEKLGWAFEEKPLRYSRFSSLPNWLLGASLLGLDEESGHSLVPPWPKLVIAAGRRLVPPMLHIKRKHPDTFLCYLMQPEMPLARFDLVAIPEHDTPPERSNILPTLGASHRLTSEKLNAEAGIWAPNFADLPRPWIALLVGGDATGIRYTDEDWHQLAYLASALAEREGGSLLITTSRRTGQRAIDVLRLALTVPHYLHRWEPEGDNPFLGMLGLADAVIVTGESMSMCSEACATGVPTFIYDTARNLESKHVRLHDRLYAKGYAQPLDIGITLDWHPPAPLDEAGRIAQRIREGLNF